MFLVDGFGKNVLLRNGWVLHVVVCRVQNLRFWMGEVRDVVDAVAVAEVEGDGVAHGVYDRLYSLAGILRIHVRLEPAVGMHNAQYLVYDELKAAVSIEERSDLDRWINFALIPVHGNASFRYFS
jgi:hypothetical protein